MMVVVLLFTDLVGFGTVRGLNRAVLAFVLWVFCVPMPHVLTMYCPSPALHFQNTHTHTHEKTWASSQ